MSARALINVLPMVIKKLADREILIAYITDSLQVITENTSQLGGKKMKSRYLDIVSGKSDKKEDTRTGNEIVVDLIHGLFPDSKKGES